MRDGAAWAELWVSRSPVALEEPPPEHPFPQSRAEGSPQRGGHGAASVSVIPLQTPQLKDAEEDKWGSEKPDLAPFSFSAALGEEKWQNTEAPRATDGPHS